MLRHHPKTNCIRFLMFLTATINNSINIVLIFTNSYQIKIIILHPLKVYENSLQLIRTQLVHNARYFAQFHTLFCRYTDTQILNRGKVFNQNFSPGSHRIFLLRFGSVINNIPRHIEKEEKSLTEMLCTFVQKHHVSDENHV